MGIPMCVQNNPKTYLGCKNFHHFTRDNSCLETGSVTARWNPTVRTPVLQGTDFCESYWAVVCVFVRISGVPGLLPH